MRLLHWRNDPLSEVASPSAHTPREKQVKFRRLTGVIEHGELGGRQRLYLIRIP